MYKSISFKENIYTNSNGKIARGCILINFSEITRHELRNLPEIFNEVYRREIARDIEYFIKLGQSSKKICLNDMKLYLMVSRFDSNFRMYTYCSLIHVHKLLQVFADETIKAEITREVFEYV